MDRSLQTVRFIMLGITLSVFLFATAAFAEGPIAPTVSTTLLIKSVTVRGTSSSVDLRTQVGQTFDESAIQNDVHRLWATGRFDDIRVETTPQEEGTAVVFQVEEAQQFVLHEMKMEPSTFGLQMTLPEGTPMNRLRAHQMAVQAQEQLHTDGFQDATVDSEIVPFLGNKVDLKLTIDAGERIRVKRVDFTGDTKLNDKELRGALRSLKIKRVLPGFPGLWDGWRLYPGYSPEGVQGDLSLIRSLYISKGYFDATVRLDDVEVVQKAAQVRIQVLSGPLYHVRQWQVSGPKVANAVVHPQGGLLRAQDFCSTLFAARRQAEREGIVDFTVDLHVQPIQGSTSENPIADLSASVDLGRAYRVGRIEFTGSRHYSEAALRHNFLLDEGQPLDEHLLRKSMSRLNQTELFEPITERNTILHTDPETGIADISVRLMERKRGSWSLSGPVGPVSFAGPLQASISSHLPAWGSGLLELSTYTASISLFAFAHPLVPLLGLGPKVPLLPVLSIQRPWMPGEGWKSGFSIIPQLGWRFSAMTYVVTQAQQRLLPLLAGDRGLEPEMPIAVETPTTVTTMFCEPPAPRFSALRNAAAIGLKLASAFTGL
jgi:outer membrane protein insertion porin family